MKISNTNSYKMILLLFYFVGFSCVSQKQNINIKNDIFWDTKDKQPIKSQGGGIFKFSDPNTGIKKYYWYGVNYEEAETYRKDPSNTLTNSTFESVTCYTSTDLINWTFEADVLTKEETNKSGKTWVGRLGVIYVKELKKYCMIVQHGNKVMFAVSDTPTGNFTMHQEISMESMIGTSNTGDQTVFTDEDTQKSYLVYSHGRGRSMIYISEIGIKDSMINLLDCTRIFKGESREGNCMFKHNNKYYVFASNIYGWDSSHAYYLVADSIKGPYLPENKMLITNGADQDYAHVTQTGFFVTVKGSKQETILYCGDRWANFAGNGLGYNQWFPLSFDKSTPYFNSLSSWDLDESTGLWNVANDNNYVKNGSFEADRKYIPSQDKPKQIQLTGWATEVLLGNTIDLTPTSPVLNHYNSKSERKEVIGEKSLNISDKTNFKRKIYQNISSTPYVKLKNDTYTLTAKVKNTTGFNNLEMYATSNGKYFKYTIKEENKFWQTISIENIIIKGEKVEIGFLADGLANSFCLVDDVVLVKKN